MRFLSDNPSITMIFDTHSHCYFPKLSDKIPEILENMRTHNIRFTVQIGYDVETSRQALTLAINHPDYFFATVGLHPEAMQNIGSWRMIFRMDDVQDVCFSEADFSEDFSDFCQNAPDFDKFLRNLSLQDDTFWDNIFIKIPELNDLETMLLAHRENIVAIGECGLDFHYIDGTDEGKTPADLDNLSPKAIWQIQNQKFWWLAQWKLAQKYNLPLVIHSRDARDATLQYIKFFEILYAVMHCFCEDLAFAEELSKFSPKIFFSFSGTVTFKNAIKVQETAGGISLKRILIETDSPFLAPQPVRGQVNEPANTRFVLDKIDELRPESREVLEEQIFKNSLKFYQLEGKVAI